ncbi:uncharacterized protein LOC144599772 [Rhinoraja longicauda]
MFCQAEECVGRGEEIGTLNKEEPVGSESFPVGDGDANGAGVPVTAEPSDAVTEGDNVTLTCSVSHVTESMRLVLINGDGKSVGEKTLNVEDKSQSLVIQKAERGRGNWRCGLFNKDLPRLFVPYYQEPSVSAETEDIHYGSINFQKKTPTGRRDGKSPSNQETDMYLALSRNDNSSVIYAQVAQTKM